MGSPKLPQKCKLVTVNGRSILRYHPHLVKVASKIFQNTFKAFVETVCFESLSLRPWASRCVPSLLVPFMAAKESSTLGRWLENGVRVRETGSRNGQDIRVHTWFDGNLFLLCKPGDKTRFQIVETHQDIFGAWSHESETFVLTRTSEWLQRGRHQRMVSFMDDKVQNCGVMHSFCLQALLFTGSNCKVCFVTWFVTCSWHTVLRKKNGNRGCPHINLFYLKKTSTLMSFSPEALSFFTFSPWQ